MNSNTKVIDKDGQILWRYPAYLNQVQVGQDFYIEQKKYKVVSVVGYPSIEEMTIQVEVIDEN